MWNQKVSFNTNITYRGGWCLAAVQDGYNSAHWFPTAIAQWNAEGYKHTDYPPEGIDVPIYFSIPGEPAGHVAVRLKNGKVASSTYAGVNKPMTIHNNIQDLINVYKSAGVTLRYLGWGEHCANLRVVEYKEKEKKVMIDEKALGVLYRFYLGIPTTDFGRKTYLGKKTFEETEIAIYDSEEYKKLVADFARTQQGAISHLPIKMREVVKLPEQVK